MWIWENALPDKNTYKSNCVTSEAVPQVSRVHHWVRTNRTFSLLILQCRWDHVLSLPCKPTDSCQLHTKKTADIHWIIQSKFFSNAEGILSHYWVEQKLSEQHGESLHASTSCGIRQCYPFMKDTNKGTGYSQYTSEESFFISTQTTWQIRYSSGIRVHESLVLKETILALLKE